MTQKEYSRYTKRLEYGYTPEQALTIPPGIPRWMAEVEKEEGCNFLSFLRRERTIGQTWAQIARSIEVKKDTLGHWVRKYQRAGLL